MMKKLLLSVLCLTLLVSATFFVSGCKKKHTHSFTEQAVKDEYLSTAADCTNKAKYFYSCSCGEKGSGTFEYGSPLGHSLNEWKIQKEATETEKGLKTRNCTRNGCNYSETENIPMLSHTHKFNLETTTDKYLATAATCTEKAQYYYSCSCGEKGSETFEYGEALNHSFTNYVSDNNATCTEDGTKTAKCDRCDETDTVTVIGSKLGHEFTNYVSDNNATYEKDGTKTAHCNRDGCTATNTIPDEGSKLESKISFKTLTVGQKNIDGNIPVYGKVSNSQKNYSFIDEVETWGNIQYVVSLDIYGIKQVATKTIPLNDGDNVVYITEQLNGNPKAVYEVTIRRREIYTVTFNSQGGTMVENQAIEEDSLAIQPASPTKKGYTFNKWTFDFSTPITENIEITAEWDIIHYNIYYNLNGGIVESENPVTYTVEETIELNVPEKTGYDFKQWDNDGKIEKGSVGDVTFTAFYTIIVYKINYDCGSGDNNSENPTEYTIESETITLKDAYYINADFIEWQKDGQKITEIPKGSFGDLLLTAVWDVYDVQLKESDGTYTVVRKNTDKTDIVIKSSYKGKPVTSIDSSAFSGCRKLTSISIPDSVTSISDYAFYDCSGLTSITIGNGVTTIGNSAFSNCAALTDVTWDAENCASAGSYTSPIFEKCYKLTNVIIGNNVKHIPSYAFFDCFNFANIYITDLAAWCNISGLEDLMGYGTNETYGSSNKQLYLKNKRITNLIIPDGVTSIGDCAFRFCTSLTSITIPDGVTFIGDSTFYGCKGLTSITIPDSVTSIGKLGFFCCEGLTNAIIGNRVTSIGDSTFYGCKGLTSITIPDSVTSIGGSAFDNSGLTKVNYLGTIDQWVDIKFESDSLNYAYNLYVNNKLVTEVNLTTATKISAYAFKGCSNLTSATIDNGITSIGDYAFAGCSDLTRVIIGDRVTSIGVCAFSGCSGLTSIMIPDSVTSIGESAFYYCEGLTNVIIGDRVTSIGKSTFYKCSSLASVTIPKSVIFIGSYAFIDCLNLKIINYNGSTSQWHSISKGADWNYGVGSYTVYCADGTIV